MKKNIVFSNNIKFTVLLFLISVLTLTVTIAQDPSVLQTQIQKSLRFIEADQPTKAVESLNALIQANATDASLLYYLGYAQIKKGELDQALASFEKGIQLNDKEPLNYAGKGHIRVIQNNPVDSKQSFDKALALTKSKNATVLNAVAEGYLSNKQYSNEALQLLLKSKSINSKNPETFILLGDAYVQQNNGNGGPAVTSYENAARLDPKIAKPYYKIGLVYARSKNIVASVEAFNKAVSIDSNYALAYKELGETYYTDKKGNEAVKAQEKYLKITENPEPGRRQLAFYYFMAKDYAKAYELFKPLVQSPDVSPITLRFYGVSATEVGDFEQSRLAFQHYFTKAKPEDIQASDYASFGKALIKMKEDSLAIDAFRKSLALDSTQVEVLQLQGETLIKKKKYVEAIPVLKRLMLLRAKPLSADYYAIGRAYYYNQQFVEADSAFTHLAELQPTMTVGHLWLARVKANEDPESIKGLAKPHFDKVIEIASATPEKNKNDLIEAYRYLGYYYYIKKDNATSISYWQKVLALVPNDAQAIEAIDILKKKP